jgi:hypothetical protein
MRGISTFLPFWEGFSVVTIKPDGDALQIDLTPQVTRFPSWHISPRKYCALGKRWSAALRSQVTARGEVLMGAGV